uniref:Uncharacterized protein n=1 Tax=Meloidogyne enterolobii TaxID=390850 RepID=A0A6V7TYU4_MELEN|nr:unnamed protein product [Meloidogyne enterolobii]
MEYIKSVGINYFNNNSSFSSKKFPKNYPKNTQILSKKMSNIFPLLAIFLYSSLIYGWKVNQSFRGCFTYYDTPGIGACGKQINPQREMLVAISASQWTSANPNADPICKNICVKVDYKGKVLPSPSKTNAQVVIQHTLIYQNQLLPNLLIWERDICVVQL